MEEDEILKARGIGELEKLKGGNHGEDEAVSLLCNAGIQRFCLAHFGRFENVGLFH